MDPQASRQRDDITEPAPLDAVRADGAPRAGRFAGICPTVDWARLAPPWRRAGWWRRLHHKRWWYAGIAAEGCFVGCAIVDLGWGSTAFAYLFDRRGGRMAGGVSRDGVPLRRGDVVDAPVPGLSRFAGGGLSLRFEQVAADLVELDVTAPRGLRVRARLDGRQAPPCLFATGPVPGGVWHATHKFSGWAVQGEAEADGNRWSLDGGWAGLDHSSGLLPRHTRWLWASAHGGRIGFNLQSGYFGDHENALWLDGRLIPLGRAEFTFDPADTLAPWQVRTDDGLVDLSFHPQGQRREDRNLLVASSRFVQAVGLYSGTVRAAPDAPPRRIDVLPGVAERHAARW